MGCDFFLGTMMENGVVRRWQRSELQAFVTFNIISNGIVKFWMYKWTLICFSHHRRYLNLGYGSKNIKLQAWEAMKPYTLIDNPFHNLTSVVYFSMWFPFQIMFRFCSMETIEQFRNSIRFLQCHFTSTFKITSARLLQDFFTIMFRKY